MVLKRGTCPLGNDKARQRGVAQIHFLNKADFKEPSQHPDGNTESVKSRAEQMVSSLANNGAATLGLMGHARFCTCTGFDAKLSNQAYFLGPPYLSRPCERNHFCQKTMWAVPGARRQSLSPTPLGSCLNPARNSVRLCDFCYENAAKQVRLHRMTKINGDDLIEVEVAF